MSGASPYVWPSDVRDRQICARIAAGESPRDIGIDFGITGARVRQIAERAERKAEEERIAAEWRADFERRKARGDFDPFPVKFNRTWVYWEERRGLWIAPPSPVTPFEGLAERLWLELGAILLALEARPQPEDAR